MKIYFEAVVTLALAEPRPSFKFSKNGKEYTTVAASVFVDAAKARRSKNCMTFLAIQGMIDIVYAVKEADHYVSVKDAYEKAKADKKVDETTPSLDSIQAAMRDTCADKNGDEVEGRYQVEMIDGKDPDGKDSGMILTYRDAIVYPLELYYGEAAKTAAGWKGAGPIPLARIARDTMKDFKVQTRDVVINSSIFNHLEAIPDPVLAEEPVTVEDEVLANPDTLTDPETEEEINVPRPAAAAASLAGGILTRPASGAEASALFTREYIKQQISAGNMQAVTALEHFVRTETENSFMKDQTAYMKEQTNKSAEREDKMLTILDKLATGGVVAPAPAPTASAAPTEAPATRAQMETLINRVEELKVFNLEAIRKLQDAIPRG